MIYDSLDVASYLAQQCTLKNFSHNNTKIQKLLYCAYGIMLVSKEKILCLEQPRLWSNGPVFPNIIKFIERGGQIAGYSTVIKDSDDNDIKNVINMTVDNFGKYTSNALVIWSTLEKSPWYRTKIENDDEWNTIIPNEYIYEYFKKYVLK